MCQMSRNALEKTGLPADVIAGPANSQLGPQTGASAGNDMQLQCQPATKLSSTPPVCD